ncbi:2Fe-2S iron-sulfur cluster-binding protein [Shouchella shacheensis]|uniref:2Fe-2S iron-sulfur cluster-binding protein n=1 Tax=Shouchella shacheensis TaxID=1649580 RepID=UPI0007404045|nr:2Fe-2S iron-sulfur cluster-binding protein [Shouchella shacheensis]
MPTIQVEGKGSFEVEEGKKLVLALEDNGVDILHRCGGNARCTTCRVEVLEGDPRAMGTAEAEILEKKDVVDGKSRLSCQIRVYSDLTVKPLRTASEDGIEPGKRPED